MIKEVNNRQDLRNRLLLELYDHHFSTGGKTKPVVSELKDIEKKLAYFYLGDKGYLVLDQIEHPAFGGVKITSYGIDYIEENHLSMNRKNHDDSQVNDNPADVYLK